MKLNQLSLLALAVAGALTVAAGQTVAKPIASQYTPKDPGVINKERILYWAQKRGELAADASAEAKAAFLGRYVARAQAVNHLSAPMAKALDKARSSQKAKAQRAGALADKTVKVLTVLVDFPDLPYNDNRLTARDTDLFYSDYNVAHYRDLMFSTNGFAAPSGSQRFGSAYQYYQAESGASLHFTGEVYDWVRADNNAVTYGGNVGEDEDDANVRDLIKEAVAKTIAANPSINLADYDQEDQYDRDGDGDLNEPDGIIDHVMVFHSSVGEEAGGGVLGADAIWSHRWTVEAPYTIPGTSYQLLGYTIQPIDAAAGVVAHEFGHDLGLPDEYDTDNSAKGEPVGFWSIMSGGSWAGAVPGTEPTGFSPYARDLFQEWYGGNWVNQTVLDLAALQTDVHNIDLVAATNHSGGVNQVRINVPGPTVAFQAPFAGDYQFWSGQGALLNNGLSFAVTVPDSDNAQLQFQAKWNIETDYDYARVLVNGTAIAGTATVATVNPHNPGITNYLTGNQSSAWQLLTFSLAAYKGQNVTIAVEYVTDPAVGDFGLVIDNLSVNADGSSAFSADAEADGQLSLDGFSRVGATREGLAQQYFVQLRSHDSVDAGLAKESYDHGVVMWFADPNYDDNNVETHPGHGFLGVVDADQNLVLSNGVYADSSLQVRDAAFRRMQQTAKASDQHLAAIFSFDDRYDYSAAASPQSGLVLPEHKLIMTVSEQATDSSTARVLLNANPASTSLTAGISKSTSQLTASFTGTASGGVGALSYLWNFGDNSTSTELSPSHSYSSAGTYAVSLTVTDSRGFATVVSDSVTVTAPTTGGGGNSGGGGGGGGGSFALLSLLLLAAGRRLRQR